MFAGRVWLATAGLLLATCAGAQQAPAPLDAARAALRRGACDSAIVVLEQVVAANPQDAEAHFVLGSAYAAKAQANGAAGAVRYGRNVQEHYEQAVALVPGYLEARDALMQFYGLAPAGAGGSLDKALEQAKAIEGLYPVVGHRARAFIYERQKKFELAKREYLAAVREYPHSSRAHNDLGQYLLNVEKSPARAFEEFAVAARETPPYMPAFYNLGRTVALTGTNLSLGEAALEAYLVYPPSAIEPTHATAHYYLGMILEKEGKRRAALGHYEAAYRLTPKPDATAAH